MSKRKHEGDDATEGIFDVNEDGSVTPSAVSGTSQAITVKRYRPEPTDLQLSLSSKGASTDIVTTGPPRTSDLLAPIMQLSGHQGEVTAARFSPDGDFLASCSYDRTIMLWNIWGNCINYGVLKGHKNAILDLKWSKDQSMLFTASADKCGAVWDTHTLERTKKLAGHSQVVTGIDYANRGPSIIVTSSDDGTVRLWDTRMRGTQKVYRHKYPQLSVCFSSAYDGFFSGGLDNIIRYWDLRKDDDPSYIMAQHTDTITGLALNNEGTHLVSNSMDNTVRIWDVRPFAPLNRCTKIFSGVEHGIEKNLLRCSWSPDGSKITAGSSDRLVYVWDVQRGALLYRLPGHKGTVNDVQFHPTQPIIASCSTDKTIFLGEIEK